MSKFTIDKLGKGQFPNPLHSMLNFRYRADHEGLLLQPEVLSQADNTDNIILPSQTVLEMAGPREWLYFNPKQVRAAIVTCGGLCPGLNAVIRGLVMQLWHVYGCQDILGIRFGYHGLGNDAIEP